MQNNARAIIVAAALAIAGCTGESSVNVPGVLTDGGHSDSGSKGQVDFGSEPSDMGGNGNGVDLGPHPDMSAGLDIGSNGDLGTGDDVGSGTDMAGGDDMGSTPDMASGDDMGSAPDVGGDDMGSTPDMGGDDMGSTGENGDSCSVAADCLSRYCASGTCAACGPNSCANDEYCAAGVCVDDKPAGAACASNGECLSGYCPSEDGVCCNAACGGDCVSCDGAKTGGSDGTCLPVAVGTDPDGECGAQGQASCGSDGSGCNGDSSNPGCQLYAAGTECEAADCMQGQQVARSTCDGDGTCVQGASSACAPYVCGPNACLTSCATNADCQGQGTCVGGSCITLLPQGAACSANGQCANNNCVDGYCCDGACGGDCEACDVSGSEGACSDIPVGTDPDDECAGPDVCDGAGACMEFCEGAGPTTTELDAEELSFLAEINAYRAANSLGPVENCRSLSRSAQGHSEDMRDQNYFSHTSQDGRSPWQRACNSCYDRGCGPTTAMAENIAAGNSSGTATFTQWMNSPGHNANMLGASFTQIGIGRATGGGQYGVYWTTVFAAADEASCD